MWSRWELSDERLTWAIQIDPMESQWPSLWERHRDESELEESYMTMEAKQEKGMWYRAVNQGMQAASDLERDPHHKAAYRSQPSPTPWSYLLRHCVLTTLRSLRISACTDLTRAFVHIWCSSNRPLIQLLNVSPLSLFKVAKMMVSVRKLFYLKT